MLWVKLAVGRRLIAVLIFGFDFHENFLGVETVVVGLLGESRQKSRILLAHSKQTRLA